MRQLIVGAAVGLVLLVRGGVAFADEELRTYANETVAAPAHAFEVTLGSGYAEGVGRVAPGRGIGAMSGAGMGFDLGIGARVSPRWAAGARVDYQELSGAPERGAARGLLVGVTATVRFEPFARIGPWLRFGGGGRVLWEIVDSETSYAHAGVDVASLAVGADVRVGEAFAIGPMVGADLTVFLWEKPSYASVNAIDPVAGGFVYAGLQATFDAGGQRVRPMAPATLVATP